MSAAAELLTVWEVEACSCSCSSPASCSSCASMWQESRCSCSSIWDVQTREQSGQLKTSLLWFTCWVLMCSCSSSSPPNTAGQYRQRTVDAAEPGGQTHRHCSYLFICTVFSHNCEDFSSSPFAVQPGPNSQTQHSSLNTVTSK